MKKIYLVLSLAAVSLAFTQSCIKCDDLMPGQQKPVVVQQTADLTVAENTSYTYTVPVALGSSSEVTTAASHAKVSSVSADARGNTVLQYTPAANYVGQDVVIITTTGLATKTGGGCFGGGGHGGGNNGGGNCGNHHGNEEQTTITTVHITVTPSANVVTASSSTVIGPMVIN